MSLEFLRKRADRAWEMAGLAREDHDSAAERKYTQEANDLEEQIRAGRSAETLPPATVKCPHCKEVSRNTTRTPLRFCNCPYCHQPLTDRSAT